MKKNHTLLLCSLLIIQVGSSQNAGWQWAKSAGGGSTDIGNGISTDASGNIFVAGSFSSPIINFGTTTLANAGSDDIFIVKYDPSGAVLWANSEGGSAGDGCTDISTDASGNIFVTGYFSSTAFPIGTTTLTNNGAAYTSDIFVAKYDSSGNFLWAVSGGGASHDYSYSISTDASGSVFITGSFKGPSITFGTTTLTNKGDADIFAVKYDSSGNLLWAVASGEGGEDYGSGISTDESGNVYLTGRFDSQSISFGTTTLANATGSSDIFVVKYDNLGNALWAKSAGGTGDDYGMYISTDNSGNVLATGYFQSASFTFGTTTLYNAAGGDWNIFVVKYDPEGNALWANSAGGTSSEYGYGISSDVNGNVLVTGAFNSPSISFGTTTLTSEGDYDVFVVKYDPSGNVLWAKSGGGTTWDLATAISTDISGNVFLTGYFSSPSLTFGTEVLTTAGSYDIFVAKLGPFTGINEELEISAFSVYPNPGNGKFTLINNHLTVQPFYQLTIYNTLGELIYESETSDQKSEIDISHAGTGIYYMRIGTGKTNTIPLKIVLY